MMKTILIYLFCISGVLTSQNLSLENVVTGLSYPVAFAFLPNNNVIITQKGGLAKIYTLANSLVSDFWNFTDSVSTGNEKGLLGVCLDPSYQTNHYIYFYYTHISAPYYSFRVVRLTENNNIGTNPFIVFNEQNTTSNTIHNGGNIRFGSDGKLYITIGNNGLNSNSQSLNTYKGKILRINSNGTIPSDNPFYDDGNPAAGNDDRIWAYGLRNSFDFCFSPINDSIYATENGDGSPDEVNFIRKGGNYGYPVCRGFCSPYNPLYKNPMTEIPGNGIQNYAPTGIMVYTGSVIPELTGRLLFIGGGGPAYSGLVKCELGNSPFYDTITTKTILIDIGGYTSLMQGPQDGYIYALSYAADKLVRLRPDPNAVSGQEVISAFSLSQNYPNPFNPVTSIKYEIPKSSFVSLKIYNVLGVEVTSLVNETKSQGSYESVWDASQFPSGVYFYEMTAGDFKERRKMVFIK